MKKAFKIVQSLLLVLFGVTIGSLTIVHLVISPRADVATEQGLGIFNLLDHAIPFTFGFILTTIVLFILYLILYYSSKNNK